MPQIGGFVGADTVSAMMVLPKPNEQNFVLIDIGTNGEIVVGNKGEFWSASAAAGPAFEGGGLQSGMHAGIGAIDKVSLTNDELIYSWLGNENTIRGICGSGALDLLACLFIGEFIAENGVFTSKARQLLKLEASANGGSQLVLFDESTNPYKIVFSQEDIRQIQLAKAALRTAIDLLLEKSKLKLEELDALYIAGSFGTFLNPSNALTIGLLPKINPQKIINIGNAAGLGAVNTLLSENLLRQSQLLASRIQHIDLAAQAEFQQSLIKNIDFYR